jgi:conjugal transfer pilus assembly protein TraV
MTSTSLIKAIVAVGFTLLATGCLPYASDFKCPQMEVGKCVSVSEAYIDSKAGKTVGNNLTPTSGNDPRNAYRDALFGRFAGLLKDPDPPMIAPPKTMRVLMLPYRGKENELFMPRYTYVLIGQPSWILAEETRTAEDY